MPLSPEEFAIFKEAFIRTIPNWVSKERNTPGYSAAFAADLLASAVKAVDDARDQLRPSGGDAR